MTKMTKTLLAGAMVAMAGAGAHQAMAVTTDVDAQANFQPALQISSPVPIDFGDILVTGAIDAGDNIVLDPDNSGGLLTVTSVGMSANGGSNEGSVTLAGAPNADYNLTCTGAVLESQDSPGKTLTLTEVKSLTSEGLAACDGAPAAGALDNTGAATVTLGGKLMGFDHVPTGLYSTQSQKVNVTVNYI